MLKSRGHPSGWLFALQPQLSRRGGPTGEQLSDWHVQGVGQFHDVGQADVALASLDRAHVGPVEPGVLCKTLLGPFVARAEVSQSLPEVDGLG